MLPGQTGCPARSLKGRALLPHTGVGLSPLWALFQGYVAAGVVMGEFFLLLISHLLHVLVQGITGTHFLIFLFFLCFTIREGF